MILGLLEKYCFLNEVPIFGNRRKRAQENIRDKFGDFVLAHYASGLRSHDDIVAMFENAYFEHLSKDSNLLEWLVTTASDVYDVSTDDTKSGCNYDKESDYTHLQDVAIRRVLKRLGKSFQGDKLLRVRSKDEKGCVLSPGNVPFDKPEIINQFDHSKQWWADDSVEDFYQKSKAILAKPQTLTLVALTLDSAYVKTNTGTYRIDKDNLDVLIKDTPPESKIDPMDFSAYSLNRHLRETYSQPLCFDIDTLAKKNPLQLESARQYIGIISELVQTIISGANTVGSTTANSKVTRVSQFKGSVITEQANFEKDSYEITLKGNIPDKVYAGLLKLESFFKCLSEKSYVSSTEDINPDFCSEDLYLGFSIDNNFKTSFTYLNGQTKISKKEI